MIAIPDILRPRHVNLALAARDKESAITEVLSRLNGDERIRSFQSLTEAINARNAPALAEDGVAICLAHGRTESVSSLIMGAGRSPDGIICPEVGPPVRLVFVAGIPGAFSSEYLRIVGAIARVCRIPALVNRLIVAKTGEEFVTLLGEAEIKL